MLKERVNIENINGQLFEIKKGEAETLAGFLLEILGNFPKKGQKISSLLVFNPGNNDFKFLFQNLQCNFDI